MPKNLVDVNAFTDPIVVPVDADARNAASVEVGFQGLANRTRHLVSKDHDVWLSNWFDRPDVDTVAPGAMDHVGFLPGLVANASNDPWVMVGGTAFLISSRSGDDWTNRSGGLPGSFTGTLQGVFGLQLTAGTDRLYTVATLGQMHSSPDGITWTAVTIPAPVAGSITIGSMAGNGSILVATAGSTPNGILSSTDGITWTVRNAISVDTLLAVTWDGTKFVAVGNAGTVSVSADGITWTLETDISAANFSGIASDGAGIIVAIGASGEAQVSTDSGVTWAQNDPGAPNLRDIAWGNGVFAVVGDDERVYTSQDGVTWTGRPVNADQLEFNMVAFGQGQFFIANDTATTKAMASLRNGGTIATL